MSRSILASKQEENLIPSTVRQEKMTTVFACCYRGGFVSAGRVDVKSAGLWNPQRSPFFHASQSAWVAKHGTFELPRHPVCQDHCSHLCLEDCLMTGAVAFAGLACCLPEQ